MEPIFRNIESFDWVTVLLFSSLLLIVIVKRTFYNRFLNFIILPFNNKYIFMYNKKEKLVNWFHVFFTIFLVINLSLFLFLSWKTFNGPDANSELNPYVYPVILGAVLSYLILKVLFQLTNGFIFSNSKVITEFVFKKLSYLNYSSIVMFMANVVLSFVLKDSKEVVYLAFFVILLINVIGWATLLRNHQKFIANNFFYFILYLCALEIAPWIILGSYLNV